MKSSKAPTDSKGWSFVQPTQKERVILAWSRPSASAKSVKRRLLSLVCCRACCEEYLKLASAFQLSAKAAVILSMRGPSAAIKTGGRGFWMGGGSITAPLTLL